jgi:hypothetical protein
MSDLQTPTSSAEPVSPLPLKPAGKVLAVTSGKGGVGKTFVAANLAAGDGGDAGQVARVGYGRGTHSRSWGGGTASSRSRSSALTSVAADGSRHTRLRPSPLAR